MADPEASVVIKGKDETPSAYDQALASMKKWSDKTKAEIKRVKEATDGFKDSMSLARDIMGGFGAVGMIRDLAGIATAWGEAALGLGDFVIKAQEAGTVVDQETLVAARELRQEANELKQSVMGLGVALAEQLLGPLGTAADTLGNIARGFRPVVSGIAEIGAAAAREAGKISGLTLGLNGLWTIGSKLGEFGAKNWQAAGEAVAGRDLRNQGGPVQAGPRLAGREDQAYAAAQSRHSDFGDEWDGEGGDQVGNRLAAERERQDKREADELERKRAHAERLRIQEQQEYERDFQTRIQREQKEALDKTAREQADEQRRQIKAQQVKIQFAQTEAEKLQAVTLWEQQELAQLEGHEDAKTRIVAEAERRRQAIIKGEKNNEEQDRRTRHRREIQETNQVLNTGSQLLGAAFGQSKGIRRAQALVNTYTGVSAALAEGPAGIPMAALIAIQGMKQVRSIESTSPGGGAGGGLGSIAAPPSAPRYSPTAPPAAPASSSDQLQKIFMELRVKAVISPDRVGEVAQEYLEQQGRDGRTTILTRQET